MKKWIKIQKDSWNLSGSIVMFNKIDFYAGRSDSWGISIELSIYDRSITFKIFNLYMGMQIYYPEPKYNPDSKGDMFD